MVGDLQLACGLSGLGSLGVWGVERLLGRLNWRKWTSESHVGLSLTPTCTCPRESAQPQSVTQEVLFGPWTASCHLHNMLGMELGHSRCIVRESNGDRCYATNRGGWGGGSELSKEFSSIPGQPVGLASHRDTERVRGADKRDTSVTAAVTGRVGSISYGEGALVQKF